MGETVTKNKNRVTIPPLFQILLIAISFVCISAALIKGLYNFNTSDKQPQLEIVTPEKISEFGGFPDKVTVGLYIDQFQEFDIVKNHFVFTGTLWFLFNQGVISLNSLAKFEFERGKILYKSEPETRLLGDKLLVQYNIGVEFTSSLDYSYFPLDDHRIYLVLTNQIVSPGEILLQSSQREFKVKPDVRTLGWEKRNIQVTHGYSAAELDTYDERKTHYYPTVLFAIDYNRYGIRYIISILLPLLLIFYLATFTFSIAPNLAINLAAGSVTAILAYRFVIENLSPKTGYLMLSDYLFFLFLSLCVFIFFMTVIDTFSVHVPTIYKKIACISLHTIVVCVSSYLFVFWLA